MPNLCVDILFHIIFLGQLEWPYGHFVLIKFDIFDHFPEAEQFTESYAINWIAVMLLTVISASGILKFNSTFIFIFSLDLFVSDVSHCTT